MATKDNPPAGPATTVVEVETADAGQRLDRVLADAIDGLTRSRLKALIADGHVTRNGASAAQPAAKVAAGDVLAVTIPDAEDPVPVGQAMDLDILFEDEHLIVLDKPPGLVVHPAPGNPDRTLVNALIAHCGDDFTGIGGVKRPGIVHRLDKDTSGVMVAAKTAAAHAGLVEQFSNRTVDRAYRAVVWGRPKPPNGSIEGDIGRHPKNRKKMAVVSRNGKPALTRYRTLTTYGDDLANADRMQAGNRPHPPDPRAPHPRGISADRRPRVRPRRGTPPCRESASKRRFRAPHRLFPPGPACVPARVHAPRKQDKVLISRRNYRPTWRIWSDS